MAGKRRRIARRSVKPEKLQALRRSLERDNERRLAATDCCVGRVSRRLRPPLLSQQLAHATMGAFSGNPLQTRRYDLAYGNDGGTCLSLTDFTNGHMGPHENAKLARSPGRLGPCKILRSPYFPTCRNP